MFGALQGIVLILPFIIQSWFYPVVKYCLIVICFTDSIVVNGPLARYVKLRVAHALGVPGTFSRPLRVSDPDIHQGTCTTHVPWCMSGSPTSGFFWSRWRGKRSRHSRRMRKSQFYVSGKTPVALQFLWIWVIMIWLDYNICLVLCQLKLNICVRCDIAFVGPMHRIKPNIIYLLNWIRSISQEKMISF